MSVQETLDTLAAIKSMAALGGDDSPKTYVAPTTEILPLSEQALKHLTEDRKLSAATLEAYGVGTSKKSGVIAIPIIDEKGKTVRVNFRHPEGKLLEVRGDKTKEFPEKDGKPILLGTHLAKPEAGPLVVCFGTYDAMALHSAGVPNACSVPGGDQNKHWIRLQYDWLKQFKQIVLWTDGGELSDEASEKKKLWLDNMAARLGIAKVRIVDTDAKDANDLLKEKGSEAVKKAVEAASFYKQLGLIRLEDNNRSMNFELAIPTKWKELDRIIAGLMPKRYTCLAGDMSSGKSSICVNIAKAVIEDGKKVFYWPGEQDVDEIQYWADLMFAKADQVETKIAKRTGAEYSAIKPEAKRDIIRNYAGQFLVYDREEFETETASLCGVDEFFRMCEVAIEREGCEVIMLDNLTAIATNEEILSGADYFQTQSKVVMRCKALAKSHSVHFIICAHTRKEAASKDGKQPAGDRDNIEGLKRLLNLADLVLRVKRLRNEEKTGTYFGVDTTIEIQKNRITGLEWDKVLFKFNRKHKLFTEFGDLETLEAELNEDPTADDPIIIDEDPRYAFS